MATRVRRMSVALPAVLGVALAVAFVGGCAAPDTQDQASFGTVLGVVVDTGGAPIAGAQVRVVPRVEAGSIGTLNYRGNTGPFVTDAAGRFVITGVRISQNAPTVLNLLVARAGFVPSPAAITLEADVTAAGRTLPAGTQTVDIVVTDDLVTEVRAVLARVAATATVSGAASLSAAIPSPLGGSSGTATLDMPSGALALPAVVSFTPLTGATLPAKAPVLAGSPGTDVGPNQTVRAQVPLAAVDLQPYDIDPFPAGLLPTVTHPIPFTTATLPAGTTVPLWRWDFDATAWIAAGNATVTELPAGPGNVALVFTVDRFAPFIATVNSTWTFGPLAQAGAAATFPPVATLPGGYLLATRVQQSLVFPGAAVGVAQLLANGFGSLALQPASGPQPVVVPAQLGVTCTPYNMPVSASITLPTGVIVSATNGVRTFSICNVVEVEEVATPPGDISGHVQAVIVGH